MRYGKLLGIAAAIFSMALIGSASAQFLPGGGVDQNGNALPPAGVYLTPDDVHATYTNGALTIVLTAVQHQPFANQATKHPGPGPADETEDFPSSMNGQVSLNGSPGLPATSSGPCTVETFGKNSSITGTFNTEMVALSLNGTSPFGPFMVRESPTLQSTGQVKITDIGGGMYHIDSFFDVFTELSIDGGNSWMPSQGAAHVNLTPLPEPGSMCLIGLAGTGMLGRRRRSA